MSGHKCDLKCICLKSVEDVQPSAQCLAGGLKFTTVDRCHNKHKYYLCNGVTGATGPVGPVGPAGPMGVTGPVAALTFLSDVEIGATGPNIDGITFTPLASVTPTAPGLYYAFFEAVVNNPGDSDLTALVQISYPGITGPTGATNPQDNSQRVIGSFGFNTVSSTALITVTGPGPFSPISVEWVQEAGLDTFVYDFGITDPSNANRALRVLKIA